MANSSQRLMAANALMYFGPLLAGLGGFGWAVVPVFAAIFILWLVIMKPQEWPARLADWKQPEALVALAARGAVQLLLVVVLFGIGRGIGGVLGALPAFPLMMPIAISFLSIPLGRMLYNPHADKVAPATEPGSPEALAQEQARALIRPLAALPDDVAETDIAAHLGAMSAHATAARLHTELLANANAATAPLALRKAMIIHATSPTVVQETLGQHLPQNAFAVAAQSPELLGLFLRHCSGLLRAVPKAAADCPSLQDLQTIAVSDQASNAAKQELMHSLQAASMAKNA